MTGKHVLSTLVYWSNTNRPKNAIFDRVMTSRFCAELPFSCVILVQISFSYLPFHASTEFSQELQKLSLS
jgi:hypothetical protein